METNKLPHETNVVKKKYRKEGRQYYKNTCRSCGKHIEYKHGDKPAICPYCGEEDYIKPLTETRLFLLQKKYLKTREDEVLWSMYVLFREYSASLIKKSLPSTFTYHYQDVEEKASELALIMFEQYKNKPNFEIIKSFGAYLNSKVPQVLWNKREKNEQSHTSIYAHVCEGEHEVIHMTDYFGYDPIFKEYNEYFKEKQKTKDLYDGISKLLSTIFDRIKDNQDVYYYILSMIGICRFIKKSGRIEEFYEAFGSKVKPLVDKTMVLIYQFLKEY
jgi:predicted RNA-binding Zn-ribbon protein involved in translation (DUF1610 family)